MTPENGAMISRRFLLWDTGLKASVCSASRIDALFAMATGICGSNVTRSEQSCKSINLHHHVG
jgi:hypothetical protein